MVRSFNTTGPCTPRCHYMLPPERRLGRVLRYVDEGRYFALLGSRQTGKTTSLRWLVEHFNAGDAYRALAVDLQTAREQPDPAIAMPIILDMLAAAVARALPDLAPLPDVARLLAIPGTALLHALRDLAARSPRPLVVFFDEADCLVGAAMVSFLTQLRGGYNDREDVPFPHAVALVGQREVRDYVLSAEERRAVAWLGTSSPFNITAAPVNLVPFTEPEVAELCAQHTEATRQRFEPDAATRIYDLSQGHPWLVNALAAQIVGEDLRDRALPVTAAHVDAAKETIIQERRTHVDSLIHKLHEPRVRKILDPMIAGGELANDVLDDDLAYVIALGLVRVHAGRAELANPIYREIVPRALAYLKQVSIDTESAWFVRPDGSLDVPSLMAAWQTFWREDGHLSAAGFAYQESGPHLMLMAFLQRVVNGGGKIEREYALGKGALDLLVEFRGARHAIEVKLRRDTQTEERALAQVGRYLDSLGLAEGWLILFDLRSTLPWDQRLTQRTLELGEKKVHVVGC